MSETARVIERLGSPSPWVRRDAWRALRRLPVDPVWVRDHPEPDPRIRTGWLAVLARSWRHSRDDGLAAALLGAIDLDAGLSAHRLSVVRAIHGLRHVDSQTQARWRAAADPAIRLRAALSDPHPALLSDLDAQVRTATLYGLAQRPRRAWSCRDRLLDSLDTTPRTRLAAARALQAASWAAPLRLPLSGCTDREPITEIRWALYFAEHRLSGRSLRLGLFRSGRRCSLPAADRYLRDAPRLLPGPITAARLHPLLSRSDSATRRLAVLFLTRLDLPDAEEVLRYAALDPCAPIRQSAVRRLGRP